MKKWGHLLEKVYDLRNIYLADSKARKGKHNIGIVKHDLDLLNDNLKLSESIKNLTYKTSKYTTFIIHEPKERIIFRLPYYPDRILHHAIMNVMEDKWVKWMVPNTYACIKNRGIHKLNKDLNRDLTKDPINTRYYLKIDIHKFYPSINHDILKKILRIKIKDTNFLKLLDEIIDSSDGVPIGNYLSLFFANLYLTPFDHWLLETLHIKYYYRYCDDIVILSSTKELLKNILVLIQNYLLYNLKLELKKNYLIYEVSIRGIDFVGYRFYRTHTILRKNIKNRCKNIIFKYKNNIYNEENFSHRIVSYFGWLKYCNSKHFLQLLEISTGKHFSNWKGIEGKISNFYFKSIHIVEVVKYSKYFKIHFIYRKKSYTVNSTNKKLYSTLIKCSQINYKLIYGKKNHKSRHLS